ncbi:MAG: cobalamin biosynthesis bifunctional protein CbiET, partial [Rhodobacteraceae bacterium]|nr:cobalamin biosynthesis bifunctional protein CbiET [Paracoccaceae bacterium]
LATIERNAARLGVPGVELIRGKAPEALKGLEAPDAVFIGGGITGAGVFEASWEALKPGGLLVANVVTLEGEARLTELSRAHGGQMTRIAVSHAEPVGGYHGWRPAMPVTQWRVRKGGGA